MIATENQGYQNKIRSTEGYHLDSIPKGKYGDISKIEEEVAELKDAAKQECKIMILVELSDIIGAIEGYLTTVSPGTTIKDLIDMTKITRRAFESGERK